MVGGIARVRRPRPAGPAPPALSDDESDFEEEEYRRRQRSTAAGKRQKGKGAVAPPALAPVGSVRLSASELQLASELFWTHDADASAAIDRDEWASLMAELPATASAPCHRRTLVHFLSFFRYLPLVGGRF